MLQSYGFTIPDDSLRYDEAEGQWVLGEIDWEPLKRTMANGGPESARRIANARSNWVETQWVRDALARVSEPV